MAMESCCAAPRTHIVLVIYGAATKSFNKTRAAYYFRPRVRKRLCGQCKCYQGVLV